MDEAFAGRLIDVTRHELARILSELCADVGAAESALLLPRSETELFFFASSNAALMAPDVPTVPINASFSGLAFRTGQVIAFADAATQGPHYKAIDAHVGTRTREFAAIPVHDRAMVGLVTLVNRPGGAGEASRPFDVTELRRAEAVARGLAQPLSVLAKLVDAGAERDDAGAVDPELLAEMALLNAAEQRIVHGLVGSLLQHRVE